jgi:hypothetical protein
MRINGWTLGAVNDLGFLKESDELANHPRKSSTKGFRRSVPRTTASMFRKPLNNVLVGLRDRDA